MEWTTSATRLTALIPLTGCIRRCDSAAPSESHRAEGISSPPGLTPLPFLESALSVDTEEPFRTYTKW
ncbi:hypothetical protein HD554DRAFT_2030187 [Boletus coccyginus]|nr:hypothetical protein HD554DRAFT_2030187 [Boletus coccyginus]